MKRRTFLITSFLSALGSLILSGKSGAAPDQDGWVYFSTGPNNFRVRHTNGRVPDKFTVSSEQSSGFRDGSKLDLDWKADHQFSTDGWTTHHMNEFRELQFNRETSEAYHQDCTTRYWARKKGWYVAKSQWCKLPAEFEYSREYRAGAKMRYEAHWTNVRIKRLRLQTEGVA